MQFLLMAIMLLPTGFSSGTECQEAFLLGLSNKQEFSRKVVLSGEETPTYRYYEKAMVARVKKYIEEGKTEELHHEFRDFIISSEALLAYVYHMNEISYFEGQENSSQLQIKIGDFLDHTKFIDIVEAKEKYPEMIANLAPLIGPYVAIRKYLSEIKDNESMKMLHIAKEGFYKVLSLGEIDSLRNIESIVEAEHEYRLGLQMGPRPRKLFKPMISDKAFEEALSMMSQPFNIGPIPTNISAWLFRSYLYRRYINSESENFAILQSEFDLSKPQRSNRISRINTTAEDHYSLLKKFHSTRGFNFMISYFRLLHTLPFRTDVLAYAKRTASDQRFSKLLERANDLASFFRESNGAHSDSYQGWGWKTWATIGAVSGVGVGGIYGYFNFEINPAEIITP